MNNPTNYVGDDAMREQRDIIATIDRMAVESTDREFIDYLKTVCHKINNRDLAVTVLTIVYVDCLIVNKLPVPDIDDCSYTDAMSCIVDITSHLLTVED